METILQHISDNLDRELTTLEMALLHKELADKINLLLVNDFASVIQILYRIDIDEKKLKENIQQRKNEPSAIVIADMIIKRISDTIETKKHFRNMNDNDIDENLKW